MTSFFGYNIIGNEASAREHLRRLQPRAMLYMDAGGAANWAAQTLTGCKVIHRVYTRDEDVMHRTPGATLAYLQARASERLDSRVYINLSCEPALAGDDDLRRLIDEQLAAMRWAKGAGVRVAGPHFAHYGLVERHWPIVEPLTTFIAQNADQFLFTVDEYFAGHAFSGVVDPSLAGGNEVGHIPPDTWKASPVPHYYHKGRVTNLFRWLKANGKPLPPTVITEDGADALGDVTAWRNSLVKAPGYTDIRGWRSLTAQWQAWYGPRGWSPQRAYLEMLAAFWREVYAAWPNIIGSCLYCWGTNNDRQWDQFRLDEADAQEFRDRLEATSFSVGVPPVTTPAEVHPPEDRGTPVRARLVAGYNVRSGPGTSFVSRGVLAIGQVVTIYPDILKPDIDTTRTRKWIYVERDGAQPGWVAYEQQFAPVDATFLNPCDFPNRVTSPYGLRPTPEANDGDKTELHDGIDLAPYPTLSNPPLRAPNGGVVSRVGYEASGYGHYVVIDHGDGFESLLGHMASVGVTQGATVQRGERVGIAGTTGRSTGVHVHWRLRWHGVSLNPLPYMIEADPVPEEPPVEEPQPEPEPEPEPEPPVNDDLTPLLIELGKAQLEAHRRRMLYEAAQADWFEATARVDALTLQLVALSQETLHVVERNAA